MNLIHAVLAISLAATASPCSAQTQQYDAYIVRNSTNFTVYYQYKWGENGVWKNASLKPGHGMIYHKPTVSNRNSPYLRFYRPSGAQAGTWTGPIFMPSSKVTDFRIPKGNVSRFWYYPDSKLLMLATPTNSRIH